MTTVRTTRLVHFQTRPGNGRWQGFRKQSDGPTFKQLPRVSEKSCELNAAQHFDERGASAVWGSPQQPGNVSYPGYSIVSDFMPVASAFGSQ